jgi:hypothetical protein
MKMMRTAPLSYKPWRSETMGAARAEGASKVA